MWTYFNQTSRGKTITSFQSSPLQGALLMDWLVRCLETAYDPSNAECLQAQNSLINAIKEKPTEILLTLVNLLKSSEIPEKICIITLITSRYIFPSDKITPSHNYLNNFPNDLLLQYFQVLILLLSHHSQDICFHSSITLGNFLVVVLFFDSNSQLLQIISQRLQETPNEWVLNSIEYLVSQLSLSDSQLLILLPPIFQLFYSNSFPTKIFDIFYHTIKQFIHIIDMQQFYITLKQYTLINLDFSILSFKLWYKISNVSIDFMKVVPDLMNISLTLFNTVQNENLKLIIIKFWINICYYQTPEILNENYSQMIQSSISSIRMDGNDEEENEITIAVKSLFSIFIEMYPNEIISFLLNFIEKNLKNENENIRFIVFSCVEILISLGISFEININEIISYLLNHNNSSFQIIGLKIIIILSNQFDFSCYLNQCLNFLFSENKNLLINSASAISQILNPNSINILFDIALQIENPHNLSVIIDLISTIYNKTDVIINEIYQNVLVLSKIKQTNHQNDESFASICYLFSSIIEKNKFIPENLIPEIYTFFIVLQSTDNSNVALKAIGKMHLILKEKLEIMKSQTLTLIKNKIVANNSFEDYQSALITLIYLMVSCNISDCILMFVPLFFESLNDFNTPREIQLLIIRFFSFAVKIYINEIHQFLPQILLVISSVALQLDDMNNEDDESAFDFANALLSLVIGLLNFEFLSFWDNVQNPLTKVLAFLASNQNTKIKTKYQIVHCILMISDHNVEWTKFCGSIPGIKEIFDEFVEEGGKAKELIEKIFNNINNSNV